MLLSPNFTKYFVYIVYDCGSVLMCQRCNTICSSGFVDDVISLPVALHAVQMMVFKLLRVQFEVFFPCRSDTCSNGGEIRCGGVAKFHCNGAMIRV